MNKILSGILVTLGGIAMTSTAYASGNDNWKFHPEIVTVASIVGFSSFLLVWVGVSKYQARMVLSVITSLIPVGIALTTIVIYALKDPASAMWLPVIIMFAIIYSLPIVVASTIGGRVAATQRNNTR